jgi:hypothetical protein
MRNSLRAMLIASMALSDNLICLSDSPAAHTGGPDDVANFVGGQEMGQCAGL